MKKVLLIEDEPLQLDLISDRLELEFTAVYVDRAIDMKSAQHMLENNKYELVITDLLMGERNAKDDVKKIIDEYHEAPIIVYTVAPDSFPQEYRNDGRTYVMDKLEPFEAGMLSLVSKLLNLDA